MENKKKENNQSLIIVAVLCAALFGISIAYAALSATLNITYSKITQSAITWNVGFQTGTVTGTKTGSSGAVCGDATVTANTATVADTTLATLHDKCVYKLKIKNTGSVDAVLSSISAKTPTSMSCNTSTTSQMVCSNVTYKLTIDQAGQSLLGTENVLPAESGAMDVYLIVEYTGTDSTASTQNSGGFTLNYAQN